MLEDSLDCVAGKPFGLNCAYDICIGLFDYLELAEAPCEIDIVGLLRFASYPTNFVKYVAMIAHAHAEPKEFHKLAQSAASNLLQKTLTLSDKAGELKDGDMIICADGLKVSIKGFYELNNGINSSAALLLDCLMIAATAEGLQNTIVKLPLCDYMALRGLSENSEKDVRVQVKRDLEALFRVSFEYVGSKKRGAWLKARILEKVGQIENGDIVFRFSQSFFDIFMINRNRYLFMYFPAEALRGSIRHNPYKYWLARKIAEHKRINLGSRNENILRVKTLISACPNFPTYAQVNRNGKRLMDSFKRDMDALDPAFTWEYDGFAPKAHDEFMTAIVKINWRDYPNVDSLREKKSKRITTAE